MRLSAPLATFATFTLVCATASAGSARSPESPARFVSKTGVRVIVQPDTNSDTVAICLFVRAGVPDEEGVSGVGAITSRALFGANLQQSADAVSRAIYGSGGSLDSRFTPDYTVFTCVTTKAQLRDTVYLLATALKSAELDSESVRRARAEVAANLDREGKDAFQVGYKRLRSQLYAESPYRQPYSGAEETLRRITPESVRRFFTRRYVPENTILSVVGSVNPDQVRHTVENLFVDYDRAAGRAIRVEPDSYASASRSEKTMQTGSTLVLAGYRAPAVGDPDYPAALVLDALLGGGKSSRLFRQVRDIGGVGYAVGTQYPVLARAAHIVAYLEYDPAREAGRSGVPTPEKLLLDTVQKIVENPPSPAEVERAKRFAAGSHALNHQRTRDRAFLLGLYETLGVGYEFDAGLAKKIEAVTPEDVARVAKKCLTNPSVVVVRPPRAE